MAAASTIEALAARREALRGLAFSLPAALWIIAFFAAPLGLMAWLSFEPLGPSGQPGPLSLGNYLRFLGEPAFVEALWNSVVTVLAVVAASTLLAYPFAYGLAHAVPPSLQRVALALAILPFWTSYVVRSYAWLLALSPSGVVNSTLIWLGLIGKPVTFAYNPGATIVGFVHFFIMLNALTIYASLVQINPRYRLAARDLGAGPVSTFLRITLPLSLPGIAVGAFLTVVLCIGDYVTPQILGGFKQLLLSQVVMMQLQRQLDLPMASALSLIMTLVVAAVYLLLQRWLRLGRL